MYECRGRHGCRERPCEALLQPLPSNTSTLTIEGIKHPWHTPGEMPVYLHKQTPRPLAAGRLTEVIINKAQPLAPAEIRERQACKARQVHQLATARAQSHIAPARTINPAAMILSICTAAHQDIAPLQIKMKKFIAMGALQLADNFRADFPLNARSFRVW